MRAGSKEHCLKGWLASKKQMLKRMLKERIRLKLRELGIFVGIANGCRAVVDYL